SEDLTSVRCGRKQKLPENPERITTCHLVLGSEGFNSGTHRWDVEVGNSTTWSLGMAAESVKRKGKIESGIWRIRFSNGEYKAFSPSAKPIVLTVKEKLQQIRVRVDIDRGTLSFSDLNTKAHIHTFTHTFTEKLFPLMYNKDEFPIKILPEVDEDDDDDSEDGDSDGDGDAADLT
ncbi:E3 ubiquitin-protein ligase TRIM39-like, partial [Morone saxatilis]|uniref:E3 ubiquitin-protein ligase TRIM39-like n=1 Tax=Morone saxatilis TaxID=34816 RepID=UPI0015E246A8